MVLIYFTAGGAAVEKAIKSYTSAIKSIQALAKKAGKQAFDISKDLIQWLQTQLDELLEALKNDNLSEWFSKKIDEVFGEIKKVGSGGNLKYLKILSRNVLAQELGMSCAAACIRQLAKDRGINITEEAVRKLAGTTEDFGTTDKGIYLALKEIFKDKKVEALTYFRNSDDVILNVLKDISQEGSWITSIHPLNGQKHAVIVDKIIDDKVLMRDPWPIEGIGKGNGVEAIVDINDFLYSWLKAGANKYNVK